MSTTNSDIETLFRHFGKAFATKDLDGVAKCLAPDFEWRLPTGDIHTGKDKALAFMAQRFADVNGPQFSDSRFEFFGDTIVQTYRVKALGHNGQFQDLAGLDVYRAKDNLILLKDAYWKQLA